jgi:ATP dependent DNA ligase domain.
MAKREFLQKAHHYNPRKTSPAGWYMSEKLDGQRAFWDGGISRGMKVADVPWANVEKDKKDFFATGLWTLGGKAVFAPGWWLDKLPSVPLDGELYIGRNQFQTMESIVRRHQPGPEWATVKYMVFDAPPLENVFADGIIDTTRFKKSFKGILDWLKGKRPSSPAASAGFETRLKWVRAQLGGGNEVVQFHHQEQLPFSTNAALQRVADFTNQIYAEGGEGAILKNPSQLWLPERSHSILKFKPWDDAEADVDGYQWGRETDLGSKLLGMMGAIWLKNAKGRFKCGGFTDDERRMVYIATGESAYSVGTLHPGEEVTPDIHNPRFPRGTTITYRYRELTDSGLPKEARFHRTHRIV